MSPTKPALSFAVLALLTLGCGSAPEHESPPAAAGPLRATEAQPAPEQAGARWAPFFAELAASAPQHQVVEGKDGWLYFAPELRHLGVGRFWGDAAAAVSRAEQPASADPLAAIVDFHQQLASAGIQLFFVPVPPKAVIYTEPLPARAPGTASVLERADAADAAFLKALEAAGVTVIDLVPPFLLARDRGAPLYCRQDTHWSPRAIAVAADRIAQLIGGPDWRAALPVGTYETKAEDLEIDGDLRQRLPDPKPAKEVLQAIYVEDEAGRAPQPDRDSPLLLLGDSHALVFHAGGDMHAEGAGLPEHLTRALGFPVDLVAVRGSGATPARVDLLRRGDGLAGKRAVVWVISVREYTEGQGWAKVPVIDAPGTAPSE